MTARDLLRDLAPAIVLAPVLAVAVLVGRSEAGIVVLEDGGTIVGKFGPEDVTEQEIAIRSVEGEQGKMRVDRRRVRWFDADAFRPTDAYFAEHVDDPIDARWEPLRQIYIAATRRPGPEDPSIDVDVAALLRTPALGDAVPTVAQATVRFPRGWLTTVEDQVTMCVARRPGEAGYAPRIHVFSAEAPRAGAAAQLAWVNEKLRALALEGEYQHEELYRLKQVPGGRDQVMITVSRTPDGRQVRALRKISFREQRTYFFSAYADAREFDAEVGRFWASLDSFEPGEDRKAP